MFRIFLTILSVATLLGGCIGSSTPDSATPAATRDNAAADTSANATGAAGGALGMNMSGTVRVTYKGVSPQGMCTTTGTPADQCQFTSPGSEGLHAIKYSGKAKHLRVAITYPTQQPGFSMYAGLCVGKPGGTITAKDCSGYQTAASPMKLDLDLAKAPIGAPIALSIGSVAGPGPGALVFAQSDFSVEGALLFEGLMDDMAGMQM